MRQAAKMYMETQVTTTSQGQVLIMLYDGAIKFLNQAKERILAKDYPGKGKLISSAIDIVNELASSLNAEKGGDLAANLSQLYFYCNKRLFMANSRMDITAIDEVIKILGGIRSAYVQIMDTPEAVAAMAQAGPPAGKKAPRAPIGVQTTPAGAPVSAARVRNAYASQNTVPAETVPSAETDLPADYAGTDPSFDCSEPELAIAANLHEQALPEPQPALPEPMPVPDMDGPLPALAANKRLAASGIYRKFAS